MGAILATEKPVVFERPDDTTEASKPSLHVAIQLLSGENMSVWIGERTTGLQLKQAMADKLGLDLYDFKLAGSGVLADTALVCEGGRASNAADGDSQPAVTLFMIRQLVLKKHEQAALLAWRAAATALTEHSLGDEEVASQLETFLDQYPALVNFQTSINEDWRSIQDCKPLLSYAVDGLRDHGLRERCVKLLLGRKARVHLRYQGGAAWLIGRAQSTGSVYLADLEERLLECKAEEDEAIRAWRRLSAILCGESGGAYDDDDEAVTRLTAEFCAKYPELVNLQSNHAMGRDEEALGYFGYATLLAFSGAFDVGSSRRMAGGPLLRKGAVETLLRHGARVDVQHGGKTTLHWWEKEGSKLLPWLRAQLLEPVPEQA